MRCGADNAADIENVKHLDHLLTSVSVFQQHAKAQMLYTKMPPPQT